MGWLGVSEIVFYWTALLMATLFCAALSARFLIVSVSEGRRREAWGWAVSFAVTTLATAYCFWKLMGVVA